MSVFNVTAVGSRALVPALPWTMLAWATPSAKARNGLLTISTANADGSGLKQLLRGNVARPGIGVVLRPLWRPEPKGEGQ